MGCFVTENNDDGVGAGFQMMIIKLEFFPQHFCNPASFLCPSAPASPMARTRWPLPTTDPDWDQRPPPPTQLQDSPHRSTGNCTPSGGDDGGETCHKTHGRKSRRLSIDWGVICHSPSSHPNKAFCGHNMSIIRFACLPILPVIHCIAITGLAVYTVLLACFDNKALFLNRRTSFHTPLKNH